MTERPAAPAAPVALLALVGPTASGKTEASIEIAGALGAEIVCLDSMLVYRGMDVGTAKPTAAQRALVPHHLIDVVGPAAPFSVAAFQRLARDAIVQIRTRGRLPLLVGGSALYYRAIVDDLAFPGTSPRTRALLESEARVLGPAVLHARLASFDPQAAARIEPSNARRIIRALEVSAITGRPFSSHARTLDDYPAGAVVAAGIDLPREVLHRRIEERVSRMMPGLIAEARALADGGFASFLTASQAIGYPEAVACLTGEMTEDEAAARITNRTKALARRQLAWFRRDPRIRWFASGSERTAALTDRLTAFFRDAA